MDPYRRESLKILALFKEMAPRGEIRRSAPAQPTIADLMWMVTEKASIDEAFLDLTPMMIERLLIAHPYLATIPEDAPEGLDSPLPRAPPIDWTNAGNVFAVEGVDSASQEETRSDDGGDEEHREKVRDGASWEDWALCTGAEIMAELREAVWTRMHYTCSAVSTFSFAFSR